MRETSKLLPLSTSLVFPKIIEFEHRPCGRQAGTGLRTQWLSPIGTWMTVQESPALGEEPQPPAGQWQSHAVAHPSSGKGRESANARQRLLGWGWGSIPQRMEKP